MGNADHINIQSPRQKRTLAWRKIKRSAEWLIYLIIDRTIARLPAKNPANIIAMCNVQLLGDYTLWMPYAKACIEYWKAEGKSVALVCNAAWKTLAESDLSADLVIGVEPKKFTRSLRYRISTLMQLRSLGASFAINFCTPRDGIVSDACMHGIAAPSTIGLSPTYVDRPKIDQKFSARIYSSLLPISENSSRFERYAALQHAAGIPKSPEPVSSPATGTPHPAVPTTPYFVVSPCASRADKIWPADRFVVVISNILSSFDDVTCILIGSPLERSLIENIQRKIGPRAINLAGKNSLQEMRACIRDSIAVLGNDSAAIHIASSYDIPSLVIMNGATYGQCIPYPPPPFRSNKFAEPAIVMRRMDCYGCQGICKFPTKPGKPLPCLDAVKTEEVTDAFRLLISRHRQRIDSHVLQRDI